MIEFYSHAQTLRYLKHFVPISNILETAYHFFFLFLFVVYCVPRIHHNRICTAREHHKNMMKNDSAPARCKILMIYHKNTASSAPFNRASRSISINFTLCVRKHIIYACIYFLYAVVHMHINCLNFSRIHLASTRRLACFRIMVHHNNARVTRKKI